MAITMDTIVKLPPAKKVLILLVVAFLIVGAYVYLAYLPQREEISRLSRQRDQKVKELNESRAVAKNLEKFKEEVAQLQAKLNLALAQLPNQREIPELLKNISKVGKASNLEFLRFRPSEERPKQFYAEVPLELVFLGTYHETGLFFDRLSKLSRIINVENFKMAPPKKSGAQQTILQTQCVATTFRFLEQTAKKSKK
jgi:type IV pilus assembly protein PilO